MAAPERSILRAQLLERKRRLAESPSAPELARLLREVDSALERMDGGTYGLCAVCHDPVEAERLLADPLTSVCLDHMNPEQRRALERDLDLALRIQTSLLPGRNLALAGWSTCYHYEPAGPVSGDYCDLIAAKNGDEGLWFFTGDVSGKGIAASLLMSHLHAIFRSLASIGLGTTELVERANRVFCESTLPTHYATLVCGRASASGEIELCNAGHCPPVLIRGGAASIIPATGLPLGMFCDGEYLGSRAKLAPGDSLVLYTDGLSEARNRAGEEYGAERITRVLARRHQSAAPALLRALLEDLGGFLDGGAKPDDLTLLVIQRGSA